MDIWLQDKKWQKCTLLKDIKLLSSPDSLLTISLLVSHYFPFPSPPRSSLSSLITFSYRCKCRLNWSNLDFYSWYLYHPLPSTKNFLNLCKYFPRVGFSLLFSQIDSISSTSILVFLSILPTLFFSLIFFLTFTLRWLYGFVPCQRPSTLQCFPEFFPVYSLFS